MRLLAPWSEGEPSARVDCWRDAAERGRNTGAPVAIPKTRRRHREIAALAKGLLSPSLAYFTRRKAATTQGAVDTSTQRPKNQPPPPAQTTEEEPSLAVHVNPRMTPDQSQQRLAASNPTALPKQRERQQRGSVRRVIQWGKGRQDGRRRQNIGRGAPSQPLGHHGQHSGTRANGRIAPTSLTQAADGMAEM